jgi:hypothetical protein
VLERISPHTGLARSGPAGRLARSGLTYFSVSAPNGELRSRALEIRLGELQLAVASRDDLISMKRASGRPVDLEDLAVLTALDEPPAG